MDNPPTAAPVAYIMDRFLKPSEFGADPSSPTASKEWGHWQRKFDNFLQSIEEHHPDKLSMLINYISPTVYELIADIDSYEEAINILKNHYVKPKEESYI